MSDILRNYEDAVLNDDLSKIQEIISELNSIPPSKKSPFRGLYKQIGDDLFEKSVELSNYDLEAFDASIVEYKTRRNVPVKTQPTSFEDNLENLLLQFCKNSEAILPNLKSHFIIALENESQTKAQLIFLTSDNCFHHPLIQRLMQENVTLCPEKEKLKDFIDNCKTEPSLLDKRYLCVLIIVPHLAFKEKESDLIKGLMNFFSHSWIVNLKKCEGITNGDYDRTRIDDYLEDIDNVCSKVFNNRDFTFEEEKIIKKFFPENSTVIDYKLLKGGFSGAKVVEVQPNKTMGGKTARFVVKFGRKDKDRKIYKEKNAFDSYINEYAMKGYRADYAETAQYEAIKYTYASSDNRKMSYQFAQLINGFILDKSIPYNLRDVIQQLIKCEPFIVWNSTHNEASQVKELYSRYINEENIIANISKIENKSISEVKSSELWVNYKKIIDFRLNVKKKACHGDLHTENLFKDDDDVFLIDFGYTDMAHAVLDHSTLEASIKFKHIPFYLDSEDLREYEEKMLDIRTFDSGFIPDFVGRPKLQELFYLVLQIRQDAKHYLRNHHDATEYFISLFMISLRQIQYSDLNQRYALISATLLSRYIVDNLD